MWIQPFYINDPKHDIYKAHIEDFPTFDKKKKVWKKKKSFYSLKQTSKHLYLKFDNFMKRSGYIRREMDHCC